MNLDLEDRLRTAMQVHTADVSPAPTLVEAVLRGGARRRGHARLVLLATPLLVAATVIGATALVPRGGPAGSAAGSPSAAQRALLAGPTGGDLAGSASYLNGVIATWQQGRFRGWQYAGQPHVAWAGTTPGGPAAVVVQRAKEDRPLDASQRGWLVHYGFIGPDAAGRPHLAYQSFADEAPPAAYIDVHDTALVILDFGRAVDVSYGRNYRVDGHIERRWQPVVFAGGVAVLRIQPPVDPAGVELLVHGAHPITVSFVGMGVDPVDRRLQWSRPAGATPVWPLGSAPAQAWGGTAPSAAATRLALDDGIGGRIPAGTAVSSVRTSLWFGYGTTPDGSRLVVGERQLDNDPSYVYAALRSPAGAVAAVSQRVVPTALLPVALALPRGAGWVVAQRDATLRYRTATSGWVDAGRNAALLPAGAVAVQVNHAGRLNEVPLRH
jgi:hypothetical protein